MTHAADPVGAEPAPSVLVGPRLSRVLVPRPRLQALLTSEPAPLTIVRAPLGFGKTTVIAQHLRAQARRMSGPAAWLRLSADTATADSFWAALLDALHTAGIAPAPQRAADSARGRVRQALTRTRRPITLVLDDVDLLARGLDHELLMILRETAMLRLIVCLRGHRRFRPALHLDIDTVTLAADDLRFTIEETEQLLRLCELEQPSRRAADVYAETGGWPELIRACALALRIDNRSPEPAGLNDSDTATAAATACLHERVLPAMGNADILDFALAICVVDAVSPELAALLDTENGRSAPTWLEHLADDGLMIITGAAQHDAYRWPPAVRRALYREAQRRTPERVLALHRVAAEWFCEHGRSEAALRHATEARDWTLVVRVIETFWESLVLTARPSLIAAFGAAPSEVIDASLLARLLRSLTLTTNDITPSQDLPSLPEDPDRLEQLAHEPDALARMRLANAIMIALRARGHHAQASAHAHRLTILAEAAAAVHSATVSPRLPGLLLQVGITHLWAGEFTPAHRAMRRAYDLATHSPAPYVARDAAGKLALLLVVQGHTDRAALWLDRHDSAPRSQGWLEDRISTSGMLARAWSALDRLDLPAAALALGEIDTDTLGGYEISATVGYVDALHHLHTNRAEEALHELSRVIATLRGVREPGSLPLALLTSLKAELLLSLGRGNHARAALAAMPEHPLLRIPRARMLLLSADPAGAIGIADDYAWLQAASPRLAVEMLVIKAVAHHRNGQPATATATLANAISAATSHELRRPFAAFAHDELAEIARELPPGAEAWLRAAARTAAAPFPARVDLIHLTDRERLILTHLAHGRRAHDIATELFLSYNTVRTYLRQIYKKLAANSRDQAVAHARAYGLIAT